MKWGFGVQKGPKKNDVIYEQPLMETIKFWQNFNQLKEKIQPMKIAQD